MTEISGIWVDEAPDWTFAHCLTCRGLAWRSPQGETFCGTCEEREGRLARALASVARPARFHSLRSALLGSTSLFQPVMAAA